MLIIIRKLNITDCKDTQFPPYSLCRRWAFQGSYSSSVYPVSISTKSLGLLKRGIKVVFASPALTTSLPS